MKQKILSLLVLLLTAATGAWAQEPVAKDIVVSPESGTNISDAIKDALGTNGDWALNITINLAKGGTYTVTESIVPSASIIINGNDATIDASALTAHFIKMRKTPSYDKVESGEYVVTTPSKIENVTITGLTKALFYDNGAPYLFKDFTFNNCLINYLSQLNIIINLAASTVINFTIKNSTFYCLDKTSSAANCIAMSGRRPWQVTGFENLEGKLLVDHNTFYNVAYKKQFFNTNTLKGQTKYKYEFNSNIFVNVSNKKIYGNLTNNKNQLTTDGKNTYLWDGTFFSETNYNGDEGLQTDPSFKDAENGDFTLDRRSLQYKNSTGDPRFSGTRINFNEEKTEATFAMPAFDATAEYELVRDMGYGVGVTVNGEPTWGEGDDSPRFLVKKNGEGKYQPETPFVFELKDLFLDQNNPPVLAQSDYTLLKRQRLDEDGTTWNDLAETDDYQPGIYCIAFIATETSAYDGTVFSGEFEIYAKNITVDPVAATGLVYNGQPQALASEAECEGGEMRYSLDGETWSAQMPTVTDAGTYTLYYKVVTGDDDPDTDYKKIENITIDKAELSSVTLEQSVLIYDTYYHQPQTVVITKVNAGEVEVPADDYTVEGDTYTDMGDYTVTVTAKENSKNFKGEATADWSIVEEVILVDENNVPVLVTADPDAKTLTIDKILAPKTGNIVHLPAEINDYEVTAIAAGALSADAGVTDIYLPDTEKPITIAVGALPGNVTIHTSLALLDDYALMNGLKPNYEGRKVMTTVTPKNRLWTLSCGVDLILPKNVTPNRVEKIDKGDVCMDVLTAAQLNMDGDRVLKSNNGVVMQGEAGESYDLVAHPGRQASGSAISTKDAKDYGTNLLEPTIEKKHYTPSEYYVLKNNKFCAIEENESQVPACKAVLKKPAGVSLARVLNIVGGEATGLSDELRVKSEESATWYDLNGRKLNAAPTKKGVYIKNGRKVVVK